MADHIETAMVAYALKQSAVTAIAGQRLYFDEAPERSAKPYAVLTVVVPSGDSEEFRKLRMGQPLMQWTCVSDKNKNPRDSYNLAYALLDAFSNYDGTMEDVVVKIIWGNGQPKKIASVSADDSTHICELEVHYEEP